MVAFSVAFRDITIASVALLKISCYFVDEKYIPAWQFVLSPYVSLIIHDFRLKSNMEVMPGRFTPILVDDSGGAALSTNEHSLPLFRYTMSSVIWPSCCEMFARFFVYIGNNKEIIRLFLIFRIIRELPVSIKYRFRSLNIWRLYICKRFSMFEPHYLDFNIHCIYMG